MNNSTLIRREHDWSNSASAQADPQEQYSVPVPSTLKDLDFTPQPMVGWYSPKELFVAGFRAVVSGIFGSYADKREIESVLAPSEWHDYSGYFQRNGEIWIDYVGDLGDGWDPTYTIARLLAEDELAFDANGMGSIAKSDAPIKTKRGNILVMGGDQVYPTSSLTEYGDRLIGPYRSALPSVADADEAPHLYVVPGNHDWYDGLGSFFQLFCHKLWIGGWKTQQKRSYFSLRLDEQLWVWGIDIQLNANIDKPQLDYFGAIAELMPRGSNIILCTAEPSWAYVEMHTHQERDPVQKERQKEKEYNNLGHLQKTLIEKFDHNITVALAGDAHNYTRYEADGDGRQQRFVSGGGGASLYPTHNMPETLKLPEKFGGETCQRKAIFPGRKASKRLAIRSLLFPFFRLNWGFSAFIGTFYLLLAWVIQSVSKISAGASGSGATLLDKLATQFDLLAIVRVLAHSPISVTFMFILTLGLIAFSGFQHPAKRIVHGVLHALAHIVLFLFFMRAIAFVNLGILEFDVDEWRQVLLFGVEMLVIGGFLGGMVFGLYLWISNRLFDLHDNEILLCQSDPDYKNFLRFHIKADGTMTIYPVGVTKVPHDTSWAIDSVERRLSSWSLQPDAGRGEPWFEPKSGNIETLSSLIEGPISISYR